MPGSAPSSASAAAATAGKRKGKAKAKGSTASYRFRVVIQTIVSSSGQPAPPLGATVAKPKGSSSDSQQASSPPLVDICDKLKEKGLEAIIRERHGSPKDDDKVWVVLANRAINNPADAGKYGIDLKSPIFDITKIESWTGKIRQAWEVLSGFNAKPNILCGTNVLAFNQGKGTWWTMGDAAEIAAGAAAYQEAWEKVMPKSRITNPFCKPNVQPGQGFYSTLEDIERATTSEALAKAMCTGEGGVLEPNFYWYFHPAQASGGVTVDSSRASHDRIEWIEFRLPPGSKDAEETKLWVLLTCFFISGAVEEIGEPLDTRVSDVDTLAELIDSAEENLGLDELPDPWLSITDSIKRRF